MKKSSLIKYLRVILGFIFVCVAIPGLYAGILYWSLSSYPIDPRYASHARRAALLIAIPLIVSGAVKWWDVWVKPAPKVGAGWMAIPPTTYVGQVLGGHGVVAVIFVVMNLFAGHHADNSSKSAVVVAKARLEELDAIIASEEPGGHAFSERLKALNEREEVRAKLKYHEDAINRPKFDVAQAKAKVAELDRIILINKIPGDERYQIAVKAEEDRDAVNAMLKAHQDKEGVTFSLSFYSLLLLGLSAARTCIIIPAQGRNKSGQPINTAY
jgi:hypothetical protein